MNKPNKVTTGGYFLKRLRDSGFVAIRLFKEYGQLDSRKWTIMVDPSGVSLIITCYQNKVYLGDVMFEFNDGGNKYPKNYNVKTQSMEIIVTSLIEHDIPQMEDGSNFIKDE